MQNLELVREINLLYNTEHVELGGEASDANSYRKKARENFPDMCF